MAHKTKNYDKKYIRPHRYAVRWIPAFKGADNMQMTPDFKLWMVPQIQNTIRTNGLLYNQNVTDNCKFPRNVSYEINLTETNCLITISQPKKFNYTQEFLNKEKSIFKIPFGHLKDKSFECKFNEEKAEEVIICDWYCPICDQSGCTCGQPTNTYDVADKCQRMVICQKCVGYQHLIYATCARFVTTGQNDGIPRYHGERVKGEDTIWRVYFVDYTKYTIKLSLDTFKYMYYLNDTPDEVSKITKKIKLLLFLVISELNLNPDIILIIKKFVMMFVYWL